LPRKTDSKNPADWLWLADSDLEGLQCLARDEVAHPLCRSKLAEVVEKILKAELLRLGWFLEKTRDLEHLLGELRARRSGIVSPAEPLCEGLADVYFSERYPGFDLDDPDWPALRAQIQQVGQLLKFVREKLTPGS
jgi:HEPN domain-containing protein